MTVKNKDKKMYRKTAERLMNDIADRIREYNHRDSNPFTIKKMVVFGSYANSDKDMLSDLDVALEWELKYKISEIPFWDDWVDRAYDFYGYCPDAIQTLLFIKRTALIQFRKGNMYVHFTDYNSEEEREIIHSDKSFEVDVH